MPLPAATHLVPFHDTPYPVSEKIVLLPVTPIQFIPSSDHAILFAPPLPTATNLFPFHATPLPLVKISAVPAATAPVHVIPSLEYAMLFVPSPTATNRFPLLCAAYPLPLLCATPYPAIVKISFPIPVHDIPSVEYAIVFITSGAAPLPTATHIVPDTSHATP